VNTSLTARNQRPRLGAAPRSLILPAAALVAAMVWALSREPPLLGECRLPDGTVLRLEAVTVGPQHCLVRGRYWQRLLAPLLPPSLRGRSGATICTYQGAAPGSVVFWTTWETSSRFTDWERAVAFDEHGSQVEATAVGVSAARSPPGPAPLRPAPPLPGRRVHGA
jgi:hypothetical protein